MTIRNVSIIAIQEKFSNTITKQLKEIIGDKVNIHSVTVKDIQRQTIAKGDVVVLSNNLIKGLVNELIPEECPIVVAKRDINYVNTKELLNLSPGQEILVVNDNKTNADETVQSLSETVFEHNYQAYSPTEAMPKTIDYIVTPGEGHLLPKELSNVIDIGSRLLDFNTVEEIIHLLEINTAKSQIVRRYFKACVSLSSKNNDVTATDRTKNNRNLANYSFQDIISSSDSMRETVELAKHYAENSHTKYIHIEGAPGTGKSMLAQAIHNLSDRSELPFVSIHCNSKNLSEMEEALFGSKNSKASLGAFESDVNGTICIEDIEELPLTLQKRLFQELNDRQFKARVITTSSKDCKELVKKHLFYDELFHLLNENYLKVPNLSERKEDLLPLINNIKQRIQKDEITFKDEVLEFFMKYPWDNNVKELYDVITYLSLLEESPIGMKFLPFYLRSKGDEQKFIDIDKNKMIISKIEEHGFLGESIEILKAFYEGKKEYVSFGRYALKKHLEKKGHTLSEQQLRARLEVLQNLGLTIVRQGRAGTTISRSGEEFIEDYFKSHESTKGGK
ncbi:sigma 54-interacting transcriptional regulator [Virgibacillus halodenitrificans]|uniref:sigma 54-interacting transcriptional regulator n=1 Tax=Virgibacillus halodenitrificans TaxID=1482 RepID=UPI00030D5468|nr:sigma 54-interacting transcriptional regulator [Virgibacillus halodenitrificans]